MTPEDEFLTEELRRASPRTRALYAATDSLELLPSLREDPDLLADILADAGQTATVDIDLVTPEATGLSARDLEAFFNADQKLGEELDEGEDRGFCHTLNLQGRLDNSQGVKVRGQQLQGCLVAMLHGLPAGFVKFDMGVSNDAENTDQMTAAQVRQRATCLNLFLTLDLIYVGCEMRSMGIAAAMLQAVAYLYGQALLDLEAQLQSIGAQYRTRFALEPSLSAEPVSASGAQAVEAIRWRLDEVHVELQADQALRRLTLKPWDTAEVG